MLGFKIGMQDWDSRLGFKTGTQDWHTRLGLKRLTIKTGTQDWQSKFGMNIVLINITNETAAMVAVEFLRPMFSLHANSLEY